MELHRDANDDAGSSVLAYFKLVCALSASHVFGLSWPPPGVALKARWVGHWGTNPGIAWICAHAGECLARRGAVASTIVGSGHADSFMFAHSALQRRSDPAQINHEIARYGTAGGLASEAIGYELELPYLGGELGPALAVSQGMAFAQPQQWVVCIIGDGELETPAALGALLHVRELRRRSKLRWLPIVNANGFRMGGAALLDSDRMTALFQGMGYEVFSSAIDGTAAAACVERAMQCIEAGRAAIWISQSIKGWPLPETMFQPRFYGVSAHKTPKVPVHVAQERSSGVAALNADSVKISSWLESFVAAEDCNVFSPGALAIAEAIDLCGTSCAVAS
jgi:xylulose-5-phosphate/fructose-6-phosphate phosphoketolase